MKSTSAVAGEEAMRLRIGKSSDFLFKSQPTPDVKIVLRECRSGEVKVWQAAVAEEGMKLTSDVAGEITISPSTVADEKRFSIRCEVS